MTIVGSFGYGFGGVKPSPDVPVFNLRKCKGVTHDQRSLRGKKLVQAIFEHGENEQKFQQIVEVVQDQKDVEEIWLGCDEGKHRSVAFATRLAAIFNVEAIHRDQDARHSAKRKRVRA